MALFDMPLEQLKTYHPEIAVPVDFDSFWERTLAQSREYPLNAQFEPVDYGLRLIDVFDVTFAGYAGQPVKGWLLLPRERREALPCVVEFIGYGGGRSFPYDWLVWSNAGYAHLVMDTRGQGSVWRAGDTADIPVDGANPHFPGFLTQGILNPETYYYRRVFTDAVRAVEAVSSHEAVNPDRIAVTGGSQGGGISIAVAGLVDVNAVLPDVPFLCHFRRAVEITDSAPYSEIVAYLKTHRENIDTVFNTLTYFDGVHFAARCEAPAFYSVALMDMICPPSTVFAAYNRVPTEDKQIKVYLFNDHEGGGPHHLRSKIEFLASLWGSVG